MRSETASRFTFQRVLKTFAAIVVGTLFIIDAATAHDGKSPLRFVAEQGVDQGDCSSIERPCETIDYALGVAKKGDEIRVSAGIYTFRSHDPAEIVTLFGSTVDVRGGYSLLDHFAKRDDRVNSTVLITSNSLYAEQLRDNGFTTWFAEHQMLAQAQVNAVTRTTLRRYVAEDGEDVGECTAIDRPCASIDYALARVKSGDVMLIASGIYEMPESVVEELVRQDITVLAGLFRGQVLQPQTQRSLGIQEATPTYIYGPSYLHREELAHIGLTLIRDKKGPFIDKPLATRPLTDAPHLPAARCDRASGLAGPFPCRNVDFVSNLPLGDLSSSPRAANDIWGFVNQNDGREYAIIGLYNGTAVIDVTDPENPTEVGTIGGAMTKWRDIKVVQLYDDDANRWRAYAYVTADWPYTPERRPTKQPLQIIDLSDLPNSIRLGGTWDGIGRGHNVYISNVDYATGIPLPGMTPFVYIAGSDARGGALIGLDITSPTLPTEVLAPSAVNRAIHDGTSVVIDDARTVVCMSGGAPPEGHNPCEVFIDFNEGELILWDLSDKSSPLILGTVTYFDERDVKKHYVHSGWWSEDKRFIFLHDEFDEMYKDVNTTMRVFDIADLTAPRLAGVWSGGKRCTDHNSYVLGSRVYMSTYRCGLTVLDVSDPRSPREVGHFDTFPSPAENSAQMEGAWGVFPFLPSGSILVSDTSGGLFIVRESN